MQAERRCHSVRSGYGHDSQPRSVSAGRSSPSSTSGSSDKVWVRLKPVVIAGWLGWRRGWVGWLYGWVGWHVDWAGWLGWVGWLYGWVGWHVDWAGWLGWVGWLYGWVGWHVDWAGSRLAARLRPLARRLGRVALLRCVQPQKDPLGAPCSAPEGRSCRPRVAVPVPRRLPPRPMARQRTCASRRRRSDRPTHRCSRETPGVMGSSTSSLACRSRVRLRSDGQPGCCGEQTPGRLEQLPDRSTPTVSYGDLTA